MSPQPPVAALMLFPVTIVVAAFCVVPLFISRLSGWALLAHRFRAAEPFYGESWDWQSGRFRGWCGYNRCLQIGASPAGLFLAVALPFRLFHPSLMIPWCEIEVETGRTLFGRFETAQLRIGTEELVTVRIYGKLVNRLRGAAGASWPLRQIEQSGPDETLGRSWRT
jgi:hypothetical protein